VVEQENAAKGLVAQKPAPRDPVQAAIRTELRGSYQWKRLRDEFSPDELNYFEESYLKLMAQFRDDVQASEETQIFDCIKLQLLMSRNLVERRKARERFMDLEIQKEELVKGYGSEKKTKEDPDGRQKLMMLESDITQAKVMEQTRTGEYVKLQERHDAILKTLKATRDQRIREIESSKQSFVGLVKELMRKGPREHEGRQMELVRLAVEKEAKRLGSPHTYADGNVDRPILSPDTVGE
jgi:hypothetical protein